MPVPTTADDILDLVRKSNLVEPRRLDAYVDQLKADPTAPADPTRLAARLVKDGILTSFQAQQILRGRYRNFTIVNKYKILEPLGAGGMSKVFLVEHLAMGHRVAMKILPIEGSKDDASLVARFKREAKAVASLNHPNVIRAHDIDSEGTRFHYIIMDYVEGVNLHDLVRKRGQLDPAAAAHYVYQTAVGLEHVHEAGLIHRDIKPGNLLVDRSGVVKILDLGLARFETDGEALTRKFDDNAILGTADFLAPEQAMRSQGLDARADLYGLGATFYFLLAGHAPFEQEKNVAQKLISHQVRMPEPIGGLRPDVPPEMVAVVEKMMAKKPEDRYQSAAEVVEALAPWGELDVPPPSEDEMPRRSPASQGSSGTFPRGSRSGSYPKAPSTVRRSAAAAATAESPLPMVIPLREGRPLPAAPQSSAALIAGLALGALVLAAAGAILLWWKPWAADPTAVPATQVHSTPHAFDETPPQPRPAPEAQAPAVPANTLVVGANGHATLAAALAAAKDGATIAVERPLAEVIQLDAKTPKNLKIMARSAGTSWKASPGADPTKPLLAVNGCEGLTVAGFAMDGDGQREALVAVEGVCPGLRFDGLTLQGATSACVRFGGAGAAGGTVERKARLANCRLIASRDAMAGVAFEAARANAFVEIEQSRVEGRFQAGVLFAGPTENVTVQRTRFYETADGVRYAPIKLQSSLRTAVVGNTFYKTLRGLGFRELPPAATSHLTIQNNLFLDVDRLALVDGLSLAPADVNGRWIWAAEDMKGSETAIPARQPRFFRKTFELTGLPAEAATLDIAGDENFTAYVNGEKVGGGAEFFNGRVYAFDVLKHLRLGTNVIAVEAVNRADVLNLRTDTPAGLFVNLTDRSSGQSRLLAFTDDTWKANKAGPDGWTQPKFDDAKWPKVKAWAAPNATRPWSHLTWDAEVDKQLAARAWKALPVTLGGNIRDLSSWEGYPVLDAKRASLRGAGEALPRDPAHPQFLQFLPSHPLSKAGLDKKPAGVPVK